jgi:hypothetical protein
MFEPLRDLLNETVAQVERGRAVGRELRDPLVCFLQGNFR